MNTYDGLTFELTEDHLKLLRKAVVRWEDCEYGAPAVDPKRPYGNSSGIEVQIAEILGWDMFIDQDEFPHLSRQQYDRARQLHGETTVALQIVLRLGTFETGTYERSQRWEDDWKAV